MLLEVLLVRIEHAIEPGEELLRAVVGVEDNRDAVDGRNGLDVGSGGDSTSNAGLALLGAVLDALAGKVGGTTLGCLEDDGRLGITGGLEGGNDGLQKQGLACSFACRDGSTYARAGDVHGRDGIAVLAGVLEQLEDIIALFSSVPVLPNRPVSLWLARTYVDDTRGDTGLLWQSVRNP